MREPVIIRTITVRECRCKALNCNKYTDGSSDPDFNVWLFVSISDGKETGHGECTPTSLYYAPGHIGRSGLDEWAETLRLCNGLIGKDARGLSCLLKEDLDDDNANSIKDAVDFALHDLVGRRFGLPVAALLGGIGRPAVAGMPVIHTDTPEKMAAKAAEQHCRYGFVYFKLKPIGTLEGDVETLQRMREKMGNHIHYYMDANYALKISEPDMIVKYLNKLEPLGLKVYEDPIQAPYSAYRYIREQTRVKLMIDEKARTLNAVLEVMREKCADMVNIHANWAGGFRSALRKAYLADLGGMATMVGSTTYLGPGAAAYQILSSILPRETPCEQIFDDVDGYRLAVEPFVLKDGKYMMPDAPGLGVNVQTDIIEELTVRTEICQ